VGVAKDETWTTNWGHAFFDIICSELLPSIACFSLRAFFRIFSKTNRLESVRPAEMKA